MCRHQQHLHKRGVAEAVQQLRLGEQQRFGRVQHHVLSSAADAAQLPATLCQVQNVLRPMADTRHAHRTRGAAKSMLLWSIHLRCACAVVLTHPLLEHCTKGVWCNEKNQLYLIQDMEGARGVERA